MGQQGVPNTDREQIESLKLHYIIYKALFKIPCRYKGPLPPISRRKP